MRTSEKIVNFMDYCLIWVMIARDAPNSVSAQRNRMRRHFFYYVSFWRTRLTLRMKWVIMYRYNQALVCADVAVIPARLKKVKMKERVPINTDNTRTPRDYAVVIPTLNAAKTIGAQLDALVRQSLPPREIVVVDSASDDGTAELARRGGARVVGIARADFDHGGTRDAAIRECGQPFVVLMTQDALPVDADCMAALLRLFEDASVAAVCGRQVARADATERERLVRAFRYPDDSFTWARADIPAMGIRAYLLSDVCAAYRKEAYLAVGGFAHPIETNEDMLIASDFLRAGYRLAYSGEARVWHSHSFTLRQEYARNRKVGAFLTRYADRFEGSEALGEGLRMVMDVSAGLLKRGRLLEWIAFGFNCAARMLGNRAGRRRGHA